MAQKKCLYIWKDGREPMEILKGCVWLRFMRVCVCVCVGSWQPMRINAK